MKQAIPAVLIAFLLFWGAVAAAQDRVWLQVEAQPDLRSAEDRVRAYAAQFGDVAGFRLNSGWYAIVLGPVNAVDAEGRLADLRGLRQIPGDSFVANGRNFRQQFWPVGAIDVGASDVVASDLGAAGLSDLGAEPEAEPEQQIALLEPVLAAEPEPVVAETPAEARRAEAELPLDQRQLLQTALQWKGFYAAAIDGDFGPGTRTAMASYQAATGLEPTGVLTTAQRNALIESYQDDLAALGLEQVQEQTAGIEIILPTALVSFDHYDPPFVHYKSKDGSGVSVLLISQAGDQNTLFGLYDIMQTLKIVPPGGERSRSDTSFTLTGENAQLKSYSYAALQGGLIKGYTLVWPPALDDRMQKVLVAMQKSFAPFGERAMDDTVGVPSADQRRDMLAGLEVRRPEFSRSGFYIDAGGTVLTSAEAVQSCGRITLDQTIDATVAFADPALGIAVLTPARPLSPPGFAQFQTDTPRLQAEVAVAGYSYEDALTMPTLSFGTLQDLRGLNGEAGLRRLALDSLPGDIGGPVFDSSGAVLGMLLPKPANPAKLLPAEVNFAADAAAIAAVLAAKGITATTSTRQGGMAPEDLGSLAANMTVLVSCWK